MTEFRREGNGYYYAPSDTPAVFVFSRLKDRSEETTAEVQVKRPDGGHVMRRRVNLLQAGTGRGSVGELVTELRGELGECDWKRILRIGCESVLAAYRRGPSVSRIAGLIERPAPPAWLCQGLLLKNNTNCWLGAASTGKSTLAKAMCVYYASGFRFCDRPMEQGVPLYLDWEDDEDGFRRVAYDVCRNLGVWPLPEMLWQDMHGRRLRDVAEELAVTIDRYQVGLVVLDAVAAAGGSPGEHMSWESVALDMEQVLGALPAVTVLALDHVSAADHRDNGSVPIKARGAERKLEYYRNQWSLQADHEQLTSGRHIVTWTNTKINVALPSQRFVTEIIHREAEISIVERPLEDAPESVARLTDIERMVRCVNATPGIATAEVAAEVYGSMTRPRVEATRVQLKRAEKRGQVQDVAGRWWPCKHPEANGSEPS